MLTDLGYNVGDAEFWLLLEDHKQDIADQNEQLAVLKARFVSGLYDEASMIPELAKLNLPSERIQRLVNSWNIARENKVKKPSAALLQTWYEQDILDEKDLFEGLRRDGYNDADAHTYVISINLKLQLEREKELDRSLTAQQKLEDANKKSGYNYQQSVIDAEIARQRLEIVNIAVADKNSLSDPEIAALKERSNRAKVRIAELQLDKAKLKVTSEEK